MARQGDVLIVSTESVPEGLKSAKREDGKLILARGEATGHHHAVADSAASVEMLEDEALDAKFLRVLDEAGVSLTHQEHTAIQVPPGDYRVVIQREYTPAAIRRVMD